MKDFFLNHSISAAAILSLSLAAHAQPLRPAPTEKPSQGPGQPAGAPARASTATGPVAPAGPTAVTVGGVAIPRRQIDTLAALMARARGIEPNAQQAAAMRRAVATNLIGQELLELEAKASGVRAEPAEIDSALNLLKGQFPDAASWREAMRRSGDTEAEVRVKISRQIRADKVLAANVAVPEPPSEAELRAFWEANRQEFPVNDSLRALQILLRAGSGEAVDAADAKRKRLESIRRELAADSADTPELLRRFMAEAARNSEGPEARIGGDLERFHPDDFHPEFKKGVAGLRVGRMSPVFRTPLGFHLVLLIEKYDGKFDSYRLQSLQNLSTRKNMDAARDMRDFLRKLAVKYPVEYALPAYRDTTESGIY